MVTLYKAEESNIDSGPDHDYQGDASTISSYYGASPIMVKAMSEGEASARAVRLRGTPKQVLIKSIAQVYTQPYCRSRLSSKYFRLTHTG